MAEARELLEIKQRLALLETRLEQVFEHLDIAPRAAASGGGGWRGAGEESEGQVDPAVEAEIQDLVAKGNDVVAIKRYRELTGLGLKEAKAAIDRLRG
jgi:large subunit ribosomal protein L7/L12